MLKAILFDLDDTLLDWSGFNQDWVNFEVGYLRRVFDYVCAEIHPLEALDTYVAEFRSRTREAWRAVRIEPWATPASVSLEKETAALRELDAALSAAIAKRGAVDAYGAVLASDFRVFDNTFAPALDPAALDLGHHGFDGSLNRRQPGLYLPAVISGPVIGDGESQPPCHQALARETGLTTCEPWAQSGQTDGS